MSRIDDKISEIKKYIEELDSILPATFEEYLNLEKKAACERYVEKIMEAVTDLAFIFIKLKKLRLPEDDADAFNVLNENKVIDEALMKRMQDAKGMRNIIAHQYGKIDDRVVFETITTKLLKDVREFLGKAGKE
ncbi:DUF86 domain-containing protein [Candidatus Woesearchaeota archaeon]|nr:DUF86 domain-containing protein [Candidatus Woesearchaeota archaeon]